MYGRLILTSRGFLLMANMAHTSNLYGIRRRIRHGFGCSLCSLGSRLLIRNQIMGRIAYFSGLNGDLNGSSRCMVLLRGSEVPRFVASPVEKHSVFHGVTIWNFSWIFLNMFFPQLATPPEVGNLQQIPVERIYLFFDLMPRGPRCL